MSMLNAQLTGHALWRPRSLYACVFLWISIVGGRFLAPFLENEANLTSTQIGGMLALQQVIYVIGSSISGSWADHLERSYPGYGRSSVMASGIVVGGALFLLHGLYKLIPAGFAILNSVPWHSTLCALFALCNAMVFPVMDGICLDFLKHQSGSTTQDYGKERMYGAISWGLASMALSLALDRYGFLAFYALAGLSTLITTAVILLFAQSQRRSSDARRLKTRNSDLDLSENTTLEDDRSSQLDYDPTAAVSTSTYGLLSLFLSSWFGASFLIAQISQSSGQAIVDNLIFLFFEDLGSSYKMMGFTVVLTVAFEIPIFQVAPKLLAAVGPGRLIQIAAISYVVRVIGYSLVPEGHMLFVLLLEPLHGVTFACSDTAGVEFVSSMVPSGYEASGQSLRQVFVGIGSVVGLFFGGWLEDRLGPRSMYRASALTVFVGCSIFSLALWSDQSPRPASGVSTTRGGHEKLPVDERTADALEMKKLSTEQEVLEGENSRIADD